MYNRITPMILYYIFTYTLCIYVFSFSASLAISHYFFNRPFLVIQTHNLTPTQTHWDSAS